MLQEPQVQFEYLHPPNELGDLILEQCHVALTYHTIDNILDRELSPC